MTALNCNQSSGKEAVAVNQKINLIFDTFWIRKADVSGRKISKRKALPQSPKRLRFLLKGPRL